jgi:hypothetical protein
MTFPFLYFGHAPFDWYEGANLGHIVEVQLTSLPSPPKREYIANLFEERFAKGPASIETKQPWLWAGPYFCFSFGERWSGAGRAAFSALTDFLLELHRSAPIAEVSLWSAREPGDSRWHVWTLAQRPLPSPRPVYLYDPVNLIFPAKRDATLGSYAPDPAFEQARQTARSANVIAQVSTIEGPLRLVPVELPPLREPSDDERSHFDKPDAALAQRNPPVMHGDYVQKASGRVWGPWRYQNNNRTEFLYCDDTGKKQSLNHAGKLSSHEFTWELHGPFMHGSGHHALFRLPNAVFELQFSTGVFTRRFQSAPGEIIHSLAWLEGDTWGMLSGKKLTLVDMSGEQPQFASSVPADRRNLRAARGQVFITSGWTDKPILFGVAAGELKKLAVVDIKAHFVDSDGESIFVTKDRVDFRLDGWEPLYDEFAIKARAKAEKARKKPSKK